MGLFYSFTMSAPQQEHEKELKVRLTDNPYPAKEVNVEIKEVRVNYGRDNEWMVLSTGSKVYNLLDYTNGLETVIGGGVIPGGYVKEIRFVLGEKNTIKIGTKVYPLTIDSEAEDRLRVMIGKKLNDRQESLLIDFDAAASVHRTGPGSFLLKPVLKLK
jgi:hypothetical protein